MPIRFEDRTTGDTQDCPRSKLRSREIKAVLQPGNLQCTSEPAGPREICVPIIKRISRSDQHGLTLARGACNHV